MSGSAILTNTGLLKIASASPLDQLTITDIAVGDGVNPLEPTATSLINEVYRHAASTPIRSTTYPDTLVFELNIPPTTGGFTVREIGAFDSEGDLIAVGTLDEIAKPTDGINLTVRINVKLQNSAQVNVFYDNQGAIDFEGLRNRNASALNTDDGLTAQNTHDATKAILITQGLSGNYGFFEKGFIYNEVGDVGIDVDGKVYTYAGSDPLPVTVSAGTDPAGDSDYHIVHFGSLKPDEFGLIPDDPSYDNTSKIIDMFNAAKESGLKIESWGDKTYYYQSDVVINNITSLSIEGNCTFNGINAGIYLKGAITELGYLISGAAINDKTITLDNIANVSKDDTLILWNSIPYSYSLHRENYYDGEFVQALTSTGSNITLDTALLTSYPSATTSKVFKMTGAQIKIRGCSFVGGSLHALQIKYGLNCELSPDRVDNDSNTGSTALSLNKCYNSDVKKGVYFRQNENGDLSPTGTDYGIGIANCQTIRIIGVDSYAKRHAVSTGGDGENGAVPCRFITIENSKLTNDPASNIYNADFHGNTIDSEYKNCEIYGSVGLAGENVSCIESKVHAWGNNQAPLIYHELVGGNLIFEKLTVTVDSGNSATSILTNAAGSLVANISKPYIIKYKSIDVELTSSVTRLVNGFDNSGQPNSWLVEDFGIRGVTNLYTAILTFAKVGSGVTPYKMAVTKPRYTVPDNVIPVSASLAIRQDAIVLQPAVTKSDSNSDLYITEDGHATYNYRYNADLAISVLVSELGVYRSAGQNVLYPIAFTEKPSISISAGSTVIDGALQACALSAIINSDALGSCQFVFTALSSRPSAPREATLTVSGKAW